MGTERRPASSAEINTLCIGQSVGTCHLGDRNRKLCGYRINETTDADDGENNQLMLGWIERVSHLPGDSSCGDDDGTTCIGAETDTGTRDNVIRNEDVTGVKQNKETPSILNPLVMIGHE